MKTLVTLGILILAMTLRVPGASADDKTWEAYFDKVAGPMELAIVSRKNYSRMEWDVPHELVGLHCDGKGDITLIYDFADGWRRALTIPKGHRFIRYDLAKESELDKVESVSNAQADAFRMSATKSTGGRTETSEKTSAIGIAAKADGEGPKLLFSASDPARDELLAEGYGIRMSWDLLDEMRAACPGSAGIPLEHKTMD